VQVHNLGIVVSVCVQVHNLGIVVSVCVCVCAGS